MKEFDVLVIGGGVVGSAIARELSKYRVTIGVLEKNPDIINETSGRNSAVIHGGFAYDTGSLKARLCLQGNRDMTKLSEDLDFTFLRCGKVLVGQTEEEYASLERTLAQGKRNGVDTLELIDEKRRTQFQVLILPNLYGDILTDEAAEFQGGVGTAGSANLGKHYCMFEAIHGSAPRMVEEGRDIYADPCSVIRAGAMLLSHIGYQEQADRLYKAIDDCAAEGKYVMTGRKDGATGEQYADYIMSKL